VTNRLIGYTHYMKPHTTEQRIAKLTELLKSNGDPSRICLLRRALRSEGVLPPELEKRSVAASVEVKIAKLKHLLDTRGCPVQICNLRRFLRAAGMLPPELECKGPRKGPRLTVEEATARLDQMRHDGNGHPNTIFRLRKFLRSKKALRPDLDRRFTITEFLYRMTKVIDDWAKCHPGEATVSLTVLEILRHVGADPLKWWDAVREELHNSGFGRRGFDPVREKEIWTFDV